MKIINLGAVTVSILASLTTYNPPRHGAVVSDITLNKSKSAAASGNSTSSAQPLQPICGQYPTWLLKDLRLAANIHFPLEAQTYALNWNGPASISSFSVPIFEETKRLWIGGYTGLKRVENYTTYAGTFDMQAFYRQAKDDSTYPCDHISTVYMLQSGPHSGGVAVLVPAFSIDLGNGEFMAFARNQVILKMSHAGADQYVVYPVQGVTLPH